MRHHIRHVGNWRLEKWDHPQDTKELISYARGGSKLPAAEESLLGELRLHLFRGAQLYVLCAEDAAPLSCMAVGFAKRPRGKWGKYLNVYVMYTVRGVRRQGINTLLWNAVKEAARALGYARYTSKAGSLEGVLTHYRWGGDFWGQAPNGELVVDSPLAAERRGYTELPPYAVRGEGTVNHYFPLTRHQIAEALRHPRFGGEEARKVWLRVGHRRGTDIVVNPKLRHDY